jgi:hypothetical protein
MRPGATEGRQLLLTAGAFDIEIRIAPQDSGGRWPISGQLLPTSPGHPPLDSLMAMVQVVEGAEPESQAPVVTGPILASTRLSPEGEFLLGVRPPDRFRILIAGAELSLLTPEIHPQY